MKKLLSFFNKYYLIMMIFIFFTIVWLNWYATTMLVIYPYYLDFKTIILSGFDISQSKLCSPTFPMWGYGWLLLLTKHKFFLLTIQGAFALFTVWYFFRFVKLNNVLYNKTVLFFKFLLVFAIPFYAFHSIRWPYSISVNLVILSLLYFTDGVFYAKKNVKKLISAGILFGLALNFRSDYYLVPVGFALAALIFKGFNFVQIKKVIIWIAFVYIMLIPWGIYTYHACGHFLLTSTNKGHVMFIGLGNLPDNKWGITQWDHDPVLKEVMQCKYGKPTSTLLYETDQYVYSEFKNRVKENPKEYMRKNIHSVKELIFGGVYSGEFYHEEHLKLQAYDTCWTRPGETWKYEKFIKNKYAGIGDKIRENPFKLFQIIEFTPILRILVSKTSSIYGRITVFLAFVLLPLSIFFSIRERNYLIFFGLLLIIYQVSVNILAYNWNLYLSNVFFMLLLSLSYSLLKAYDLAQERFNFKK